MKCKIKNYLLADKLNKYVIYLYTIYAAGNISLVLLLNLGDTTR
jgi:hypothetical protein